MAEAAPTGAPRPNSLPSTCLTETAGLVRLTQVPSRWHQVAHQDLADAA
jgi:hypothetical protein